ncbi:nicotinamide phosphoribosyltransferase [Pectobacterium phage Arno162]|uniref:Nicotinamide phosphoribosyltransferase n=1 Tax=Pectobacterium phage Arno162 TaxID=2500577 RepID=A0A679A2Q1_9CAUD|nr:nicotinamide phosphoribosyltransferase [Pectobacterium phage Arno162]
MTSIYASPAALNADSYKSGHKAQYPLNSEFMLFNFTARSDKYFNTPLAKDGIISFGIRRFVEDYLRDHWNTSFFNRPKPEVLAEIDEIMNGVLGAETIPMSHWAALHDLGYLPVGVDAVPEGTLVPMKVPMMTFFPTHPDHAWVAGYLEDAFSNENWKVAAIATIAFHYKRICLQWAEKTCDNTDHIPWQCHDFALRGMSGMNDGALNNIGHLTSFKGTDSFPAVYTTKRVYGKNVPVCEIGNSVPATEHSVMTANIMLNIRQIFAELADDMDAEQRYEAERATFEHMITVVYPTGIASLVADSFNFFRTIGGITVDLKDKILARQGKLVFRPDSGNPYHIVCGYEMIHFNEAKEIILMRMEKDVSRYGALSIQSVKDTVENDAPQLQRLDDIIRREAGAELLIWNVGIDGAMTMNLETKEVRWMSTVEMNGALATLWDIFGGTWNDKGYKLIDEHVGLIYGDSITMELAQRIFSRMEEMGFASSNIVYGVGSFTYQYITRDTFGDAVKSTYLEVRDQNPFMLCKEPVTDMGLKKSAKGCVYAIQTEGGIKMVDGLTKEQYMEDVENGYTLFNRVFFNGECKNGEGIQTIRDRVASYL